MAVIERSAQVPYGADQMLALVNDIDAYPEFLHWCHAARIEKQEGQVVEAAMEIGFSGIWKTIRTRNTTEVDESAKIARIDIDMLEGPLRSLRGSWEFDDRSAEGCAVTLRLEFEVHRSPIGLIIRNVFDEIANSQLKAFIKRARVVYGEN